MLWKIIKTVQSQKVGVEKALEKFRKKEGNGPADMGQKQIDEAKKVKIYG